MDYVVYGLLSMTSLVAVFGATSAIAVAQLISNGLTLGMTLAVAISFSQNRSVLWAIIHSFLGWLYVFYYLLTRKRCHPDYTSQKNPPY
jgi:hypothetical protein